MSTDLVRPQRRHIFLVGFIEIRIAGRQKIAMRKLSSIGSSRGSFPFNFGA
jgi:hypothetical protein